MKHKLIKTENYLLVVDESEIKVSDWCIMFDSIGNIFSNPQQYTNPETQHLNKGLKKIIAHLPLNNAPILEGVPLLPPIEDDVEQLAYKLAYANGYEWENTESSARRVFEAWAKEKAKEKYKYTEQDLRIAIQQAFLSGVERLEDFGKVESMIIGNIQQPKYPVGFECEIEVCVFGNHTHYDPKIEDYVKPKTTTNSQGQTQLVGTYIYE